MGYKLIIVFILIISGIGYGLISEKHKPTKQSNLFISDNISNEVRNNEKINIRLTAVKSVNITDNTADVVYKGSKKSLSFDPKLNTKETSVDIEKSKLNKAEILSLSFDNPPKFNVASIKVYIEAEGEEQFIKIPVSNK